MRIPIVILLISQLLAHVDTKSQDEKLTLPDKILGVLNSSYPGWSHPKLGEPWLQNKVNPHLIVGDFDGDGNRDYAVHIQHTDTSSDSDQILVIAFLQRDNSYAHSILEVHPVVIGLDETLTLMRKGSKGYDVEFDQEFIYPFDAINFGSEKGSITYYWKDGGFTSILTGD